MRSTASGSDRRRMGVCSERPDRRYNPGFPVGLPVRDGPTVPPPEHGSSGAGAPRCRHRPRPGRPVSTRTSTPSSTTWRRGRPGRRRTGVDLSQAPIPSRPRTSRRSGSGTVEFPDGTHVENPHTDALGYYVYKTHDDYVGGTDKHVVE
ncbi:hypothetical protein HBB16_00175 [Pseudonocardia sp. MCCB 268]|nr:hypothetical protein [Pseudonocardia cytotoxica]